MRKRPPTAEDRDMDLDTQPAQQDVTAEEEELRRRLEAFLLIERRLQHTA